jgi:hypothetical protein
VNPLKLLLDYKATDRAVEVHTVGGILLTEVPFADIERIHHGFPLLGLTQWWANRLDLWHSAVTLRRRSGWPHQIVITPDQPEQFIATVKGLMRRPTRS